MTKNKIEKILDPFELVTPEINSFRIHELRILNYNSLKDIPKRILICDLRGESDYSPGFDNELDLKIANDLMKVWTQCTNFNQLFYVYQELDTIHRNQKNDYQTDLTSLTKGNSFDASCVPLSGNQSAHGAVILEKISMYCEELHHGAPYGLALENGCGHGLFIPGFARHFRHLYVVDISLCFLLLAAKIIEEENLENVSLFCANIERLPFKSNSFDFVHSNNVIEHVNDQTRLLMEGERVINNSGLFFLLSPNRNSFYFEPHFRVPFFGFIPTPLASWMVMRFQKRSVEEVKLLSLRALERLLIGVFGSSFHVTFLPRHLKISHTKSILRKIFMFFYRQNMIGPLVRYLLNQKLLSMMPYHAILCFKRSSSSQRCSLRPSYQSN